MEVGIITAIVDLFVDSFEGGFDRIRPAVTGLLHILVCLDVLFFALMVLFGLDSLMSGFRKVLAISLWMYVVQNFDTHAKSIVNSLIEAGLMAAGSSGSPHQILEPSRILDRAFEVTEPLTAAMTWTDPMSFIFFGLPWLFILLAFAALALNASIVVIEYYLALAVAGILMPFGVLPVTRWLAMKPVSFVVATGLKLMVITFIMSISDQIVGRMTLSEEPTFREAWVMFLASITLAMIAWIAPQRLAAGFMAGSASLGGSDALGYAAGLAGTGAIASRLVKQAAHSEPPPGGSQNGGRELARHATYSAGAAGGATGLAVAMAADGTTRAGAAVGNKFGNGLAGGSPLATSSRGDASSSRGEPELVVSKAPRGSNSSGVTS